MITPKCGIEQEYDGRCCLNCLYHREQDGHWCGYAMDDYDNEILEKVSEPETHRCFFWEEG